MANHRTGTGRVVLLTLIFCFFSGCFSSSRESGEGFADRSPCCSQQDRKKVLIVNSYHRGMYWTDGIVKGALQEFGARTREDGEIDDSRSRVLLRVIYMDTKRKRSEVSKQEAASRARALIDSWQPDAIISSDDNAARYLIAPYYRNAAIPVVFCGINMDAAHYGFPCRNITGIVEVPSIPQLLQTLRPYARGERIGYLGADTFSSRKDGESYGERFGVNFGLVSYVGTFEQWKRAFITMQEEVDLLIIGSPSGIAGWDDNEARQLARSHTMIPSGTNYRRLQHIAVVSYAKVPLEQGEWAAATALAILDGKEPEDIPVDVNRKFRVYLNMKLAKKLRIKFPMDLIESAGFVP